MKRGIKDGELPIHLRDVEIARSRKGKAGQIVVHSLTGVQNTTGAQLARKIENEIAPSREDLIEKLQASGNPSKPLAKAIEILANEPNKSLARAIAEAGADVGVVLDSYAKGALALKKLETVIEIYKQLPHMMRDLARHAIDRETDCEVCLGTGLIQAKAGSPKLSKPCFKCAGSGKNYASSEHKEFAVGKLLEMGELLPKRGGPLVNVNQAVQVNNAGASSDILARLSKAADEIIYGKREGSSGVVDAELVEEEK